MTTWPRIRLDRSPCTGSSEKSNILLTTRVHFVYTRLSSFVLVSIGVVWVCGVCFCTPRKKNYPIYLSVLTTLQILYRTRSVLNVCVSVPVPVRRTTNHACRNTASWTLVLVATSHYVRSLSAFISHLTLGHRSSATTPRAAARQGASDGDARLAHGRRR